MTDPVLPGFEMQQQLQACLMAALAAVPGVTHVGGLPHIDGVHTDGLCGALLITTAEHGQFVCRLQPQVSPLNADAQRALNPVTFRSQQGVAITIGRLHVGTDFQNMQRHIPVAVWQESNQQSLAIAMLDEATFMTGLLCLFPHGELAGGAKEVCRSLVTYSVKKAAGAPADELARHWQELVDQARTALT